MAEARFSTIVDPVALAARAALERNARILADADERVRRQRAAEEAYARRTPVIEPADPYELRSELPSKPSNILYRTLSDPKLNRGLENLAEDAATALLGEGTGSIAGDIALGFTGPGAAVGTVVAGNRPGVVDVLPGGGLLKAGSLAWFNPANRKIIQKHLRDATQRIAYNRGISMEEAGGNPLLDVIYSIMDAPGFSNLSKEEKKKMLLYRNIGENDKLFNELTSGDKGIFITKDLRNAVDELSVNDFLDESKQGLLDEVYNVSKSIVDKKSRLADMTNLLNNNPAKFLKKYGDDVGDENLKKMGANFTDEQKKRLISSLNDNDLARFGLERPVEEVKPVESVKKEKVKEFQLPKSEQQRIRARETALKTYRRDPNKVFKSIEKGREPEDYFKGERPEGFDEAYQKYLADKAARKQAEGDAAAARAAQPEQAAVSEKALERQQADEAARQRIREEREAVEARKAAEEAARKEAYDANRPSAVLARGWLPEEHPLYSGSTKPTSYETIGGKTYPLTDSEKRDLFVADSIAGTVLRGVLDGNGNRIAPPTFAITDPEGLKAASIGKDRGLSNAARHQMTNYETTQGWPEFTKRIREAQEKGLFSDEVKWKEKTTKNKDGSTKTVLEPYLQLGHKQLPLMENIYGVPGTSNSLNLYDLMFRRQVDDIINGYNEGYLRDLNVNEPGSRAARILEGLNGKR